jgi:two-component system chemotaxis response regulator CheB
MNKILRVLVVDDSAYVRKAVRQMLSRSPFIEVVGTAHDGLDALEQVERLHPDVVTLDLIMPNLDGVGFLRAQAARRPVPVVVVSVASETGELAFEALAAGAVDLIQKPTTLATDKIMDMGTELIEKVKAAGSISGDRLARLPTLPATAGPLARVAGTGRVGLVVIGVSTGGPQALRAVIPRLPADLGVPVAMVLHMPVGYTEMYARRLNGDSALTVIEAAEGSRAVPGTVLLAPAGRHLTLHATGSGVLLAHLDARPFDTPHRPAVDVLFRSAAEACGERVLGVVMTGMGSDGKEGAAWIKAKGGLVYTEAEESCVVYGMPRSVVEAGLSDRSIPLDKLAQAILEVV